MDRNVFVTGADRGLGLAHSARLLQEGWHVFAGQYMPEWDELSAVTDEYPQAIHRIPLDVSSMKSVQSAVQAVMSLTDHLDVLINNAGVNSLGPLRMVEAFLPLMEQGNSKRLCFVSSEAGSIGRAERTSWFNYCMSKAALNMAVKILFNDLHPAGYTFRVYHPGPVHSYMNTEATLEPDEAAARAIPILLGSWKQEDRLFMIDHEGKEWPW